MIAFIDDHRGAYGVEPIYRAWPIAPSACQAHVARRLDPSKRLVRTQRGATVRVFAENFEFYGARKV